MIKKDYQKPTMKLVKLQHQVRILAGSDPKTLSGEKGQGGSENIWRDLE